MTGHQDTKPLMQKALRRVDIKAILRDPVKRRLLLIKGVMSIQAMEGRYITFEQAAEAVDSLGREADGLASD